MFSIICFSFFTLNKIGQSLSLFFLNAMKILRENVFQVHFAIHSIRHFCSNVLNTVCVCVNFHNSSHRLPSSKSASASSSFALLLHIRHLQQTIHGAASSSNGDATSNSNPKPAKIPMTCARCHTTDARE